MFHLHTSNDAAKLADGLARRLQRDTGNPLVPTRILVPQAGLRRWLQVYLAERLGVVANLEFSAPAQFAWELLRAAQPELPRQSPFDRDVLRWHLYAVLGGTLDGEALAPLRHYLAGDGDPLRRYALAGELANVYERMQGYRRRRLLGWERDGGGDWQAEIWRRLLARIDGDSRAARVEAWLRVYDPEYPAGSHAEKAAPPGLPDRLACFACANVSPDVLRMLAVAGLHCEVDFDLPLPSREYLGDTPRSRRQAREYLRDKAAGNPLIVSLGGAAAEFVELLYGYEHVQPDDETDDFEAAIARTSLLGRLRDDILEHAAPRADDREALPDDSLQFHACHTPLREVQTLHDALLARFEADPELQPRDVAVMMPDVAAYRPAIEAVFGGVARDDPAFIPYNLGDAGADALHPVAQLFLDLLDTPASRWGANELLDMLAAPGVMRRFDLDADALERLARRVRDAGVRWGEDERARAECGGYREFSWAFGIDRILAGFACGDGEALVGGSAPLDGVEGQAFAHLDALLGVIETWRRLRDLSRHPRSAADWQQALNETLDGIYEPDPSDLAEVRALERIRGALEQLANDCAHAGGVELPWPDVRACLREQLADADPHQYLFTGGVTFCGMVPLRVVPFRVICLLGMDETAFPRREPGGLDPLLADRRDGNALRGDRNVRADDRLLFLQLLSAARDAFYVSWVGRDAHTNESRPPSTVVAELMDLVAGDYLAAAGDDATRDARAALLPRREPLQPFDPSLFAPASGAARSFHDEWLPAARTPLRSTDGPPPFAAEMLPASDDERTEIPLEDLKQFFDDPAHGFLRQGLAMQLPRGAADDADLEPLQPDEPLLRYRLTSALLERGDDDAIHEARLFRAQGRLPPGEFADAALALTRTRAATLQVAIADFTGGAVARDPWSATLELDATTRLAGSVSGQHPAGLVRASAGNLNGQRAMRAWIDMLFATAAAGETVACRLFWIENDEAKHVDLETVDPEAARNLLAALVAAMRDGLRRPLPLFARASWDALKRWRTQKGEASRDEFLEALRDAARNDADSAFGGASDITRPAARMAWRGVDLASPGPDTAQALYDTAIALLPRLAARRGRR